MAGLWGNNITFTVQDADLLRKLRAMTTAEHGRVFQKAIRDVSGPLMRAVKANTPVGPTGNLRRSIGQNIAQYQDGKVVFGFVGPRWYNQGRHGHLVEHGTTQRYTRLGHSRGVMPSAPFLGPVYEANRTVLEEGLSASLRIQIEGFWQR